MTTETIFTLHAMERSKERRNYKNQRTAIKNIELAIARGKRAEDFTSWERNYLYSACTENKYAIAYNNFCYIVSEEGCCITMFPLPVWFGKKKHFDGKERIRNYKKYCKNNSQYCESYAIA